MVKAVDYIWLDGKLIAWQDANVHILTHALHYGTGVFEGIKFYKCVDGRSAVFRLWDHVARLFYSAGALEIKIPFSDLEIMMAILDTIRKNKIEEGYIRPIVFVGEGDMGPLFHNNPIRLGIIVWEWPYYLGEKAKNGISVNMSMYWRRSKSSMPFQAKVCGNYVNSYLARKWAQRLGADEAIILSERGYVAEGSAENIFTVLKNGIVLTPSAHQPILQGITRDSVMVLIKQELNIPVIETDFQSFQGVAEVFLTGTAAEITPVREINQNPVGSECPGPVTQKLMDLYAKTVRGELPVYQKWLTYV